MIEGCPSEQLKLRLMKIWMMELLRLNRHETKVSSDYVTDNIKHWKYVINDN